MSTTGDIKIRPDTEIGLLRNILDEIIHLDKRIETMFGIIELPIKNQTNIQIQILKELQSIKGELTRPKWNK